MAWQEGAFYIVGSIIASLGAGVLYSPGTGFLMFGTAMVILAFIGEWNND